MGLTYLVIACRFHYSRHIDYTERKKQQIKEQEEEGKAKLFFKNNNGKIDFRFWRATDIFKLSAS